MFFVGGQISKILITHYHEDHTHGLQFIRNKKNVEIRKGLCGLKHDEILQNKWNFKYEDLNEGEIIGVDDDSDLKIKPIKCPGHTDDHFGFLFFPEKIFFCGDCILGNGSTSINNLTSFMSSLEKIKNLNDFEHLFPAHGDLIFTKEKSMKKINEYIEHRMTREEQIMARLKKSKCSIDNLVESIYPNILDSYLIERAKENVNCHLEKLINERRVNKTEGETFHLL